MGIYDLIIFILFLLIYLFINLLIYYFLIYLLKLRLLHVTPLVEIAEDEDGAEDTNYAANMAAAQSTWDP